MFTDAMIGAAQRSRSDRRQLERIATAASHLYHRTGVAFQVHVQRVLGSYFTLVLCKLAIGAVAAYDTYLTLKYAKTLHLYEQNPVGRWLMQLDNGPVCDLQQVAAFISAKMLGTVLVLIILQLVAAWRKEMAGAVAIPVACFQLYLLYHLSFLLVPNC